MGIRGSEYLIILLIVVLLFGVGRISKVFGELGKGIRSFKAGLEGEIEDGEEETGSTDSN